MASDPCLEVFNKMEKVQMNANHPHCGKSASQAAGVIVLQRFLHSKRYAPGGCCHIFSSVKMAVVAVEGKVVFGKPCISACLHPGKF